MSVGFGSDVDEDVEVQLNLSELQLSEIRLAFTEVLAFSLKFLRYLIRAFSFHPAAFN
jgi:hypothetical protein